MNIIAVDDERRALNVLKKAINKALSKQEGLNIVTFEYPDEALEYAEENKVDIAFLDIRMNSLNGLVLAKKLKEINEYTNIIFVTGYSEYAKNAFDLRASGYITKPVTPEQITDELENLRNPVIENISEIYIQCFGNFEIFKDGKPISFARSKSKEILAYLVDRRGAGINKKEMAAILWEDEEYTRSKQIQLQVIITEMLHALEEAGAEDIIINNRGNYSIDRSKVDCDYYNYEKGNIHAVNSYRGEYMNNYSWAEFTAGFLTRNKK